MEDVLEVIIRNQEVIMEALVECVTTKKMEGVLKDRLSYLRAREGEQ